MIERFGDSKTTLMTRLDHRKQEANETVRDYVDAMRLLFAKTSYPAERQTTKFTSGLNSKFRNRVQNNMPSDMDRAVEIALYFEDLDIGSSPEKAMATAKGRSTDSEMARLTDRFDKLALSLTEAVKYERRDSNGGRGHQSGNSQQQHGPCFHCKQTGHKSVDCPQLRRAPPQPVNHYAPAGGYGQQYYAAPNRHQQQPYAGQGRYPGPVAQHGATNYLMERSAAPPTHADHMPVNYEAAMYAAQA